MGERMMTAKPFDEALYSEKGITPLTPQQKEMLARKARPREYEQALGAAVESFLVDLAKWGLDGLKNWLQSWVTGQTILHSRSGFYVPAGDRLHIALYNVDDQADLLFNNEELGSLHLGDEGVWLITEPVKKGTNVLVTAVNNSGRYAWSVQVDIKQASSSQEIPGASYYMSGNDYLSDNKHLITTRFIGY